MKTRMSRPSKRDVGEESQLSKKDKEKRKTTWEQRGLNPSAMAVAYV